MLCSNCGTNFPDSTQTCPQCGRDKSATTDDAPLVVASLLVCSKCGTHLPSGSQFCLKCGQPVVAPLREDELAVVKDAVPAARAELPRTRSWGSITIWSTVLLLAGLGAWIGLSDNPAAQELREDITGARTQTIVEASFPVKAHSFSYYEFTVPAGAVNVTVSGKFNAVGDAARNNEGKNIAAKNNAARHDTAKADAARNDEDNIEVYVLTASAFVVWRNGYATSSYYESGRSARGAIQGAIPSGAGSYYLVFSNNFSPRTAKTVHATVLLHYRAVLSESLLHLRERLWSWMGFD